jgi:flagellin
MGLRINTNVASQAVQSNLKTATKNTQESMEKLSSGKRINKAADDAAGLAIAKNLEAETKGLRQATRNANDGVSLLQVTEGGLNEVSNILVRLRELSVQAASDTVGEQERGFLDQEYQQLVDEVDRISESTSFAGRQVLNGDGAGTMDFQVGNQGDENSRISFDSTEANASSSNLGISGSGIGDKGDAHDSMDQIDEAINSVSSQRATLGAVQSRLQSAVSNLDTQVINQDAARSMIEDADIAQESSKLASANVAKNASISTLAQANNLPNNALRLIS